MSRRTRLTLFLVVTCALAAYGVLSTPTPRAVAGIGSADAFTCLQTQDGQGSPGASPVPRPSRGTVPEGFTPVKAVVCGSDPISQVAADATASYVERHYIGDFDPVIDKLNAPS